MIRILTALAAAVLLAACTNRSTESNATADSTTTDSLAVLPAATWPVLDTTFLEVYKGTEPITFPPPAFEGDHDLQEDEALKNESRVSRLGDSLIFKLDNGQTRVLVDSETNDDQLVSYVFQKSLPEIGHWQLFVIYYESFGVSLVDQRDGTVTELWSAPTFSPDKKYFLTSSADIEAGFVPNGFQLFEMVGGKPELRWSREQNDWGAENLLWVNDTTLYADQLYRDADIGELNKRVVKLRMKWPAGH